MLQNKREIAREFKVSERHVERMMASGRWPFYKLSPKVIRFDPEEIKALGRLIAEGKQGGENDRA